jgi:outer membrane protein assembly factor BamA
MNRFPFVLAIAIFLNLGISVFSQTASSVAVIKPCENQSVPDRPSLKRRTLKQDDQSEPVESEDSIAKLRPCEDSTPEARRLAAPPLAIKFEGLTVLDASELLKLLREHRAEPSADPNAELVAKAEALIRETLSGRGYRHAAVSSRFDQSEKKVIALTFVIQEGPRIGVSEIRFEGNRVFPAQTLLAETNACLMRYQKEEPDRFDPAVFEYCLHRLTNFERSQGYLKARFGEPRIEEVRGGLIVTISADEGVRYRIGNLQIEGADHVAEQEVRALLNMRRGDVVDGEKLVKCFYEDLKALYGEKGFIQYTAEITPEYSLKPGAAEGIADLTITIDEGRRFRIRRISFKGAGLADSQLRSLLLIGEGDIYNQETLEQSLKKINDTDLFYPIDKDRDVDYRTNEEEGLLDIQINVKRKDG